MYKKLLYAISEGQGSFDLSWVFGTNQSTYVYCISALISLACDNFDVEGQIMASF
jgi:hypothetical protein